MDRIHWFSDGFVQLVGGDPEPHVLRWQDAAWLTVVLRRPEENDPHVEHVAVGDQHGNVVAVEHVIGGIRTVSTAEALARNADQVLLPLVVPPLMDAFDAGERITFGDLGIDREGITNKGRDPVPWREIRLITVNARLKITVYPQERRAHTFDLDNVRNGFFAWQVIEHAAGLSGVRVRCMQDNRLPSRVRYRP